MKKIFNLFPILSLQKISFALILFSCCSLLFFHLISIFFSFHNSFLLTNFRRFRDRMAYQECREFLAPQGRKYKEEKMELRGSLVSRDSSDRGAPGMIGLKGDKCYVGCSRGRCFWNSLRWPIYVISSADITK